MPYSGPSQVFLTPIDCAVQVRVLPGLNVPHGVQDKPRLLTSGVSTTGIRVFFSDLLSILPPLLSVFFLEKSGQCTVFLRNIRNSLQTDPIVEIGPRKALFMVSGLDSKRRKS